MNIPAPMIGSVKISSIAAISSAQFNRQCLDIILPHPLAIMVDVMNVKAPPSDESPSMWTARIAMVIELELW